MKKRILTLGMIAILSQAYAQKNLRSIIEGQRGISQHSVQLAKDQQVSFSPANLNTTLGLDAQSRLVLASQFTDKLGYTHYRFYQTWKNITVENSMFTVHVRKGMITGMDGEIVTEFDPQNTQSSLAKLSSQEAINAAIAKVQAKLYAWQDEGMEQRIKEQKGDAKATYAPATKLVWYNAGENISPRDLRLAYKVDIYAREPLSRADYFIDAQTGVLLGKKDKLYFTDATGTAATAYSGSQTIHSDYTGTNYRLRDYTKGNGVITLHGESGQRGIDYTSTSANWTLTGTNIAALDAHYGVSQTYAFYLANFNRNSYDNAGTALYSYVNDPTYTDNAFWDGTAMNFNKRSNSTTYPGGVTGIDVTGHELTHGVTQATSALNYSGESGAMNESMSDIFGKAVQFWSKPSDVNWLMSNDMNWIIRDLSNPNAQGQPDTYQGTYWYTGSLDNGGVHTNSGVGNYMFYLLSVGGSGTNDKGNSFTVSGIGLSAAEQIIYRTETVYLTATSKYADWRTACINAATDLYGASSNQVTQVQNAWYAVGIGTAGGGGGCNTPTGLASSSITSSSATVSWTAVSGATSYNLQYKTSAASTWTTVSGITTTSYNLTGLAASTAYNYQVQTVCASGSSAYSTASSFTTTSGGGITYCTTSGSTTYEYINKVTLGAINNTSGNNNGYADYTGLTAGITTNNASSITLTPGFTGSAYTEYWTVFVDYNKNGVFTDAGEQVTSGSGSGTVTLSFTPPASATLGATRMRIIMHYGSSRTTTCGTFTDGEVEDYTVNIAAGSVSYCTTSGTTPYEHISKVSIGSINNTSGNNGGYANYTAQSTALTAGTAANITLTPGFASASYNEYWTVYIDYNQNGVFTDAGELATSGNGTAAITRSFTPPATAKNGATRMRIMMHYGSSRTTTCGTFTYGEVEDYTVNISGGTGIIAIAASNSDAAAAATAGISVAPNPIAGGVANVAYHLTAAGNASLRIVDLSGRSMQTIQLGKKPAGAYNYTLNNLSKLAAGNYIIVLQQNGTAIARSNFVIAQ